MAAPKQLKADQLHKSCDPAQFRFKNTADLEPLDQIIGQDRAIDAVEFGIGIRRRGFNIFALGRSGSGKFTTLQLFLGRRAQEDPVPDSWCYVYNFGQGVHDANCPVALQVPAGEAHVLRAGMDQLVEELLSDLPVLFEGDQYAAQRDVLDKQHQERTRQIFDSVGKSAQARGTTVVQGPDGVGVFPLTEAGEVMAPEQFRALPEADQETLRGKMQQTEAELETAMRAARTAGRDARSSVRELDRSLAAAVVDGGMESLRAHFAHLPQVIEYLNAVAADVLDQLDLFRGPTETEASAEANTSAGPSDRPSAPGGTVRARRLSDRQLRRYSVNVLVEHELGSGAPVVVETHPTLANLVGRIEYDALFGSLVTDFTMIRPGALHRANGGYLILEIAEVLKQPYSWDSLKRALRNQRIRIEASDDTSSNTTVTLEPAEIPLECKVVLVGDPNLYYLLHQLDDDFPELFKVGAEFGETMPRSDENNLLYARFIATVAQREGLLPLDGRAVSCVVDHGARLAEDSARLSTRFLDVTDLIREADYWARLRHARCVRREDVKTALDARERRLDLARDLVQEAYRRNIVVLSTDGAVVGQINGLTVVSRGQFDFGLPVRITARVRMGNGEVVDIEREVELSGPIHSKGVLILSGFIAGRYLPDEPLAMLASLTFEQSYGEVEGDSASVAELCVLMSALSGLPIRQSLAVTGSVNQTGQVQAIGGVNEKVEGFFDICRQRELTGDQGVLIPSSNVQHLMLRDDLVAAVKSGRFHLYPIAHVDEAIELLTGVPAGERGADGEFLAGSVNRLVEERLHLLAEKRRELAHPPDDDEDDPPDTV